MAKRKKKNLLNYFLVLLLIVLTGILGYRIYQDKIANNSNDKTNQKEEKKTDTEKKDDKKENNKNVEERKENSNNVTNKPSQDEKTETKNENKRRGGNVTLELIGEENITISQGSNYNDEGVKAYYSDGSDASVEVDVDNAVDTSKKGTYTVTYYAGNSVVIRRVTVE